MRGQLLIMGSPHCANSGHFRATTLRSAWTFGLLSGSLHPKFFDHLISSQRLPQIMRLTRAISEIVGADAVAHGAFTEFLGGDCYD